MTDSCSNITEGLWKEAKKATCLLRMNYALSIKRLGYPSENVLREATKQNVLIANNFKIVYSEMIFNASEI